MPPQRQCRRLTTEELARALGMLECGSSQRRVASVFGVSQSVISRAGIASRRMAQLPSAMLVVDNEQPRQERINFLSCRPDVIPRLYEMS